jgi:RecG-like helicase
MRPEALNSLFAEVQTLEGVGPKLMKPLEKLGLRRVKDIAYHLPERFVSRRAVADLDQAIVADARVHQLANCLILVDRDQLMQSPCFRSVAV